MPDAPPNLRFSDCERDCGDCRAFKPESQACSMFSDWPVSTDLLCDAWEAKASGAVSDDGDGS